MTLLLSQFDVERLLTPEVCAEAVEDAFRRLAEGKVSAPGILGMHAGEGSRTSDEEVIVFDSTGTGLQDVAAAIATYRRARGRLCRAIVLAFVVAG